MTIDNLPDLIASLPPDARQRVERLFEVTLSTGRLTIPDAMRAWAEQQFGSVEALERQCIVRVTNRWTFDGTLFNPLRARRPTPAGQDEIAQQIAATEGDPFCHAETGTPADVFGRVRGRHSITAANVAKYEAWCAVVMFDEHNPLHITRAGVDDAIRTAWQWGQKAYAAD